MASQNTTITNCLVNQNGDGIHYEISYGGQIYNNVVSNSKFSRDQIGFNPTTLNALLAQQPGHLSLQFRLLQRLQQHRRE